MTSPYLDRPLRTLAEVLAERDRAACRECGLSADRHDLCDRWDCPDFNRPKSEIKLCPGLTAEHWAVSVFRSGEKIVTIESNCLSGRDLSADDEETIRNAAKHLLAFVGD